MISRNRFQTVCALIVATFNQDWRLDYENWQACLIDELSRGSLAWKLKLVDEIRQMAIEMAEDDLTQFFAECQAGFDPEYDADMTHYQWLLQVAEITSKSVNA